ncbi:hypothetical protein JCM10908_003317 [Rhodotorula pacifica]|uniref:Dcp1 family protein n=1 Tax=Rhodotorula pacifica TaxID=1495444 RepID=UPI0031719BE8
MSGSKDELRRQLNLKNLQRHDPSIDRIVASTSYASIYDNKGQGWVKTGVEGPMFLFSRTTAPHYGFFVLNRNGLEYVQEFLTPESEVQVGGEFILYESGKDADRATGIWVFEEKERHELCRQMEQVRARAASSEGAKATAPGLPRGKPISVDMLFSAASPTPAAATLPASSSSAYPVSPLQQQQQPPTPRAAPAPMNPLDALFASATMSPRPAPAQPPQQQAPPPPSMASPAQQQRLPATLEQLFAAASPTPQAARLPAQPQQLQQQQSQASTPAGGGGGGMALLDSIFAAAAENSSPRPAAMRAPAAAAPPYATPQTHSASLPYSPQLQSAPRPAPPVQQQQQQQVPTPTSPPAPAPRDARDLLAMLGGLGSPLSPRPAQAVAGPTASSNGLLPSSSSFPTAATTTAPPVQREGKSSPVDLASKPHTTVHPQGLSMDVQPGSIAPDFITSPKTRNADLSMPEQQSAGSAMNGERAGTSTEDGRTKSRATPSPSPVAVTPMFAPPVLSHDIFDSLPLPGKKKEAAQVAPLKVDGADTPSEEASRQDGEPARSENRAVEAARASADSTPSEDDVVLSPKSPTSTTIKSPSTGPQRPPALGGSGASSSALLINKAELVSRVDGALAKSNVGMTNGTGADEHAPLSKEEFVAKAMEVIQKPSFLMQLYGRYLERYEEAHE